MSQTYSMLEQAAARNGRQQRQRIHRNSIERGQHDSAERPPEMPAQNPKQHQLNQMAKYLNRMDSRLSQPKLQSPIRRASQNGSQASLRRSIDDTAMKSPERQRLQTNVQVRSSKLALNQSTDKIGAGLELSRQDSQTWLEKRNRSVIMKNNSMAELYSDVKPVKITKPSRNMRNSINGGSFFATTSSQAVDNQHQRLTSIEKGSTIRVEGNQDKVN